MSQQTLRQPKGSQHSDVSSVDYVTSLSIALLAPAKVQSLNFIPLLQDCWLKYATCGSQCLQLFCHLQCYTLKMRPLHVHDAKGYMADGCTCTSVAINVGPAVSQAVVLLVTCWVVCLMVLVIFSVASGHL